jgi:hypothetical protein
MTSPPPSAPSLRPLLSLALALSSVGAAGCERHLYSPPAQYAPLDAPRVLAPGETAVQLRGSQTESVLDGSIVGGTVGVRRGVAPSVEIAGEATGARVKVDEDVRSDPSRTIVSGRVSTKVEVVGHHVSVLGGLGGGHHAAGGFVSPDLGVTAGYDNRYLVPFVQGRVGVSQPVGAKTLDLSRGDEAPGAVLAKPRTSYFYGFTLGARLPIEPTGSRVRGGILAGLSFTEIRDKDEHRNGLGGTLGGEILF